MNSGLQMIGEDTGDRFNFALSMHMKLGGGGFLYVYRCEDFGITCSKYRGSRKAETEVTFAADDLDDQIFESLDACVAKLRAYRQKPASSAGQPSAL